MKICIAAIFMMLMPAICFAQAKYPHVDEIIEEYDANGDGLLTKEEVSQHQRYSRQFVRWDADGNGRVSAGEIATMRAKFGIAADGSMSQANDNPSKKSPPAATLSIPDIADLARIDRNTKPTREQAKQSAFVLKTKPHPVVGNAYVILTDHSDEAYLEPLRDLAEYHDAKIYPFTNLAALHQDNKSFADLREDLSRSHVRHVAIAPRLETFSENMALSMWELLSTLDEDPQLDCFPGFLVASNPISFSRLIDQSINHKPISPSDFKPFAINQVQNATETRSLQKSAILRKHFKSSDVETPIVAIYGPTAAGAARLEENNTWNLTVQGRRQFVKEFPAEAQQKLAAANLVVMHGHGVPGMSCSMDVEGIPNDFLGKVLLSGSCFSASPVKSDFPKMNQAPGGYEVKQRDAFVIRAIDNGAIVAFGHQRLSSGFPHLYPVLENWTQGKSVGQAYQQLLNALIESTNRKSGNFIVSDEDKNKKRLPQNSLLYVVIGDPALSPFEPQPFSQ